MAFDKSTRNRLASFVGTARNHLADEFTQQFRSLYGISDKGVITSLEQLGHLDDAGLGTAILLRERIDYLVRSHPDDKDGTKGAVDRLAREQAFTVLNRLAAIRMAEKRDLVVESVGKVYQSKGFQVFEQVAGAGLGETYQRYCRYLFCLFDELAVDLGMLFDRRSPQGLLFPRESALQELLKLLNAPDLDALWVEDETIGWIYQYYNDPAELKKMHESGAPRNSRELAVRNQFFTPRYVVEFLTGNTLGRIWYEMTRGQTRLKDECRYLVRRPTEIFLNPGDATPDNPPQDGLSQEELLKQPYYIAYRPLKDPRDIRMLDPACGSMHFGLYAFDLFEIIYDEAWELEEQRDADALSCPPGMKSLHDTYTDKDSFLKDVPRLIIEHNLHGIDIDPRAAQIAGLSLWLRAQRTWQQQGLRPQNRPRIRRSNIVCAEPMPGDEAFLEEFIATHLSATPEGKLLGQLVRRVFDAMKLAGEAGSLLKIEEEIADAVIGAKEKWLAGPKMEQGRLFADNTPRSEQLEFRLDVTGITDETFWEESEENIYTALEAYAEQAEDGGSYQRRLFADDAACGFAFIDLCRKRHDVVLMNPPFGKSSEKIFPLLQAFHSFSDNIAAPFAERFLSRSTFVAMVLDRALLIRKTHETFRRLFLGKGTNKLRGFANYGWGVLDANVEVAALVAGDTSTDASYLLSRGDESENLKWLPTKRFAALPNLVISDDVPDFVANAFATTGSLADFPKSRARVGHQWKSERYLRLWWESADLGPFVYNGAPFSPYVFVTRNRLLCDPVSSEVQSESSTVLRNTSCHYQAGVAYGKRGIHLDAHPLPGGQTFTVEGLACFPFSKSARWLLLAYLNSLPVSSLLSFFCGQHKHVGYVNLLPFSSQWALTADTQKAILLYVNEKRLLLTTDETSPVFVTNIEESVRTADLGKGFNSFSESLARLGRRFGELHAAVNREVSTWLKFPDGWERMPALKETVDAVPKHDPTDIFEESGFESSTAYISRFIGGLVGVAFGRWDIRFATGEKPPPELPDPFKPLPACPLGQLRNEQGLPITKEDVEKLKGDGQWDYPIDIPWDGILVDDPGHLVDFEIRVPPGTASHLEGSMGGL